MLELPEVQAEILRLVFEEMYRDDQQYFTLVDIEEVYALLIGDNVSQDIYDNLEATAFLDEFNLSMIIFLHELLDSVESNAVKSSGEFYELANNCLILKNHLHEIIHTSDCGDLSEC